ncbi:MAG: glutamine synthetase [Acidimicrobiia bacterium]|nr:glutamine synthetase [Acidimicrobiia bacterium]
MTSQREHVLQTVTERGVRFVRLWFTDVQGFLKSFAITTAELEVALAEGMMFDGSVVQGYSRVQESDMLAVPDPSTFELLAWVGDEAPVARMICDICLPSGEPFPGDPRYVLRRNLERARRLGFTLQAGPEMEFFAFASADRPEPVDRVGYFDHSSSAVASSLRRRIILELEAMGTAVEYSHHEVAPSQHEIDLRPAEALVMADSIITFRTVVKELARALGVHATFMPKPLAGVNGSGMHTHLWLYEGDTNAFADRNAPDGLSSVARHFIAGLLEHARAITAVTNPWVNSYKRLVPGYEAPVHVCWARNNRSALVRVPAPARASLDRVGIEYRAPDPSCNPYLALAVIVAAGLDGIERGLALAPEAQDNLWSLDDEERRALGIASLPTSLDEAIDELEGSELAAEALGEHVFAYVLANKREEWREYAAQVTQFELDRYLDLL